MRVALLEPLRWITGLLVAVIAVGTAGLAVTDQQAMPVGIATFLLITFGSISAIYRYADVAGLLFGSAAYAVLEQSQGRTGVVAWGTATTAMAVTLVAVRLYDQRVRQAEKHLRRVHQTIEDLTLYDRNSGLLKRQYGEQLLDEEVQRARRTKTDLSLVLLALDPVPDHPVEMPPDEEEEASLIGDMLRHSLRVTDHTVRLGPSTFAAILPATSAEGGAVVAHKFCAQAESRGSRPVRCAVAAFPHHAVTKQDLLEEAEAALRLARAIGLPVASPSMLHDLAAVQ